MIEFLQNIKYKNHLIPWLIFLIFNLIEAALKCNLWEVKEVLICINIIYILSFYLQYSIICPKFANPKSRLWLVVSSLTNITFSLSLVLFITTHIPYTACDLEGASQQEFSNFMNKGIYHLSYLFLAIKMNTIIVFAAIITYVSKVRIEQKIQIKEFENIYLKSQLSPHFLLNSLNNIYSLAVQKSEKILPQIENLAELLKYSLYKIQYDEILLKDEIDHLQLYLNTIICKREDDFNISIEVIQLPNKIIKIKPLILFNFIENAVKHSAIESNRNAWIKLRIEFVNDRLHFIISNSKSLIQKQDGFNGIGLLNTKQRLEAYYKDKYSLEIENTEDKYQVNLYINFNL